MSASGSDHVTGRIPTIVDIVACGPTFSDWVASNFGYDSVIGRADEVWTLNKGLRTYKADLVFVMDDLVGEGRLSEEYRRDINALTVPVITSIIDADVQAMYPNVRLYRYPIAHVLWAIGFAIERARGAREITMEQAVVNGRTAGRYIQNSIPYMLAYAWWIGVKRVRLFGADYTFPGSPAREDDRANAEYWVGLVRGLGMEVSVPDTTTLLDTRARKGLYGYGARQPLAKLPSQEDMERYAARYA